jgi:hypothetical protein
MLYCRLCTKLNNKNNSVKLINTPLKMGIVGLGKMGGIQAQSIRDAEDVALVSG